MEAATTNLENSRNNYAKECEKLNDSSRKLAELMGEMAKLDLKKIDFEEIKKILKRGIKALAKLREEWTKLVRFFQMMSNIIDCCLSVSLKNFVEHTETSAQRALEGYSITSFRKDLIYQQAFQAAKIAYLVNMISGKF